MMQESAARLPSLISPSWNPQSCTSVVVDRDSAKKTVSVSGLMNGQHGRPHINGHQHIQQSSGSRQKQAQQQLAKAAVTPTQVASGPTGPSGAMGAPAHQSQTQQQHQRYSGGAQPKTHRERWGGWLSGSSNSLGRSGDSLPRPRGDLPYHTQGYDMTKLYPELSAKLGLTKSPPDNTNQVKNGINIKETTTSGMLRKLEQVDERIKIVSTDHILNNFKLINKVESDVQNPNPNNMKFSKLKAKSVGSKIETCDIKDEISRTQQNIHNEKLLNKRVNDISSQINLASKTFGISSKSSSSVLKEQMQMGGISSSKDLRVPHFVASGSAHTTIPVVSRLSHGTPPSTVTGGRSLVSGQVTYPPSTASQQPRMVQVPPRRRRHRPPTLSSTQQNLPETIVRVQNLQQQHYAYVTDLFPLGIEMSESSDGSDLEDNSCSHLGWLDSKDHCYVIDSSSRNTNSSQHHKRQLLLNTALASHRRQVSLWNERLDRRSWSDRRRSKITGSLVNAARSHPNLAADTCHNNYAAHTNGESPKLKTRRPSSVLLRRTCVYEGDSGSGVCSEPSLPGTRHCIRHITYNVDQQLFTHCSARQPDNTRCTMPAADVMHHLPLCTTHTRKKENFIKVKSEESQKPKRTRKKNKMPILSRYGKRNKKRRRPSNSTSSVIPSTRVRPPMSSQTSFSSPQPSPTQSQTSPQFSTASCTGDGEGSEFEDDMKDMVGELPLDAAEASRLLDPRDLQDVLNRIPDHELTQLFNDGKGSDYEGSDSGQSDREEAGNSGGSGGGHIIVSNNIDGGSSGPRVTNPVTTTTQAASGSSPKVPASNIKSSVLGKDGTTTLSLDESTFNELVAGNIPIDSIISSSFNQQELNTISQALSNIVEDSNINLTGYELATDQGTTFSQSQSSESNQTSGLSKANDTSQHPCQAT